MQPYIADISNNSLALSACNIAKIFSKGFSLPFARANNSSGVTLYFAKAYASSFTLSSYPVAGKLNFSITSCTLASSISLRYTTLVDNSDTDFASFAATQINTSILSVFSRVYEVVATSFATPSTYTI